MNLKKERYIILEIIPSSVDPAKGDIVQLSALKLNGLILEDRFDYRLEKKLVKIPDLLKITNYDNESFKYVKTTKKMLKDFKSFVGNMPLLIIDNLYTRNYLASFSNEKLSVFKFLDMEVENDVFDKMIKKYSLEPSNYLVDLLYEALIKEL